MERLMEDRIARWCEQEPREEEELVVPLICDARIELIALRKENNLMREAIGGLLEHASMGDSQWVDKARAAIAPVPREDPE